VNICSSEGSLRRCDYRLIEASHDVAGRVKTFDGGLLMSIDEKRVAVIA